MNRYLILFDLGTFPFMVGSSGLSYNKRKAYKSCDRHSGVLLIAIISDVII